MGDCDDGPVLEDAASEHSLQERVRFNINRSLVVPKLVQCVVVGREQGMHEDEDDKAQRRGKSSCGMMAGLTVASSRTRILLGVKSARASEISCR